MHLRHMQIPVDTIFVVGIVPGYIFWSEVFPVILSQILYGLHFLSLATVVAHHQNHYNRGQYDILGFYLVQMHQYCSFLIVILRQLGLQSLEIPILIRLSSANCLQCKGLHPQQIKHQFAIVCGNVP